MDSTGTFTNEMKEFFNADAGGYTSFTAVEIRKGTFNVKSVIRNMLIEKIGRDNIPVVNVSENQSIKFNICPKAKIYGEDYVDIPCKFSKKEKDEMTIYFNTELINFFNAEAGDYWYIYFIKGSDTPIVGIMSKDKWENLFDLVTDTLMEPDEEEGKELNYMGSVSEMQLLEEDAPVRSTVQLAGLGGISKSVSAEKAALREKNRKKKGNRGEEIAIEIEKRRLKLIGREDLISKIAHVAKYKDGLGYDLISTDLNAEDKEVEIYIEVKATSGDKDMPFYVTAKELEVSRKYRELYYIYRIYEMRENSNNAKYYRLSGAIDENYELKPTEYRAKR